MSAGTAATRDASLPLAVAQAELAKAVTVTRKDLCSEWSKATKEATDTITEKFSHLMTGSQSVILVPCVPKEDVVDLHAELKILTKTSSHQCAGPSICCRCLTCTSMLLITLYQPHTVMSTKHARMGFNAAPRKPRLSSWS